MTICIVTSNFEPQTGGIASFSLQLANVLLQAGHTPLVLTPGLTGSEDDTDTTKGFTVVRLRTRFVPLLTEWEARLPAKSVHAAWWIAAALSIREWLAANYQQWKIDCIDCGDYGGLAAAFYDLPLPVLITGHGSFSQVKKFNAVNEDEQTTLLSKLETIALNGATAIITHSDQYVQLLEGTLKAPVKKALPPFILPATVDVDTETGLLVVAGGLQKIKGADTMLQAMQLLDSTNSYRLEWAGADTFTAPGGNLVSKWLAEKYPAVWQHLFTWKGALTPQETIALIGRAAIVIIPSDWEAFNYVALEAAALEKPIIITAATGASELFTHGTNAWIVPAANPAVLAEAIKHLMNNPSLRKQLGIQAKQVAKHLAATAVQSRLDIYADCRQPASYQLHEWQQVLQPFTTTRRKFYIRARNFLKKITGR